MALIISDRIITTRRAGPRLGASQKRAPARPTRDGSGESRIRPLLSALDRQCIREAEAEDRLASLSAKHRRWIRELLGQPR